MSRRGDSRAAARGQRRNVTHVDNHGERWEPGLDPQSWKQSWANPLLVDSPPGYSGAAGPERDAAWQAYLRNFPADPGPRGVLPKPDAVGDPGLRIVAHAATQLGVSFAWGGGNSDGPSPGVVGDVRQDGSPDPADDANTYQDANRVGFDCSGLVQYSVAKATGLDIGKYTGAQITSPSLTIVGPTEQPRPGDLVFFGAEPRHVAVYVAPGVVVNARQSGQPVKVEQRNTTVTATAESTAEPTVRIRRVRSPTPRNPGRRARRAWPPNLD